jgi:hypothetical protein
MPQKETKAGITDLWEREKSGETEKGPYLLNLGDDLQAMQNYAEIPGI